MASVGPSTATPERLMAAATAEAGLGDFGDDSFREGLDILVRSFREEARLNATGEAVVYPRLVSHLVNRLQVEDWYRRHPETEDVPIVDPLFGLSLPRTGSTVLSFLLAQDPGVRYLRQWESSAPCPPPATVQGPDPRSARRRGAGRGKGACAFRRQRADGVPGHHGSGLPDADVPRLRSDPVLRAMGHRCRPHVHLPLRTSSPEAVAMGRTGTAVATEVAGPHAVDRLAGPGLSRRAVRDDAPRPDRCPSLGVRCLRGHRRHVHRRAGPWLHRPVERGAVVDGH